MAKNNGKGGKKGKGPATKKIKKVIKQNKRTTWTLEQKAFACNLKREGKRVQDIKKAFEEKFGLSIQSSTLATFYNEKNMERYRDYGQKDTRMASVETSINKTQRPTIIVDMEFALVSRVQESSNRGNEVTN